MKHSKFVRILAVIMSLILFNSAITVSASAYSTPTTSVSAQTEENQGTKDSRVIVINEKVECDVSTFGGILKALVYSRSSDDFRRVGYALLEHIWEGIINAFIPEKDPKSFINEEEYKEEENFYPGTNGAFLDEPAENAVWKLGYSQKSITPDMTKEKYYPGGYLNIVATKINPDKVLRNEKGEIEDMMKVRAVALDAGNGTVLFATIDAIGLSNADVRDIRQRLSEYAKKNNIVSINVFATHCHSAIDTMGIWTNTFPTIFSNLIKNCAGMEMPASSVDQTFMKLLKTRTVAAMKEAYENMEEGTLTFASFDTSRYTKNERLFDQNGSDVDDKFPGAEDKMMERFVFTPSVKEGKEKRPTMIVNSNVHPNIASADSNQGNADVFSSDYVYAMEKVINEAGYNFMFFNGAISGIKMEHKDDTRDGTAVSGFRESSHRYGYEMGFHMIYIDRKGEDLAIDMEVIEKRDKWLPASDNYKNYKIYEGKGTPWYTYWVTNEKDEHELKFKDASDVIELEPILNIRHKELRIKTTSPLMKLVCKANIIHANVLTDGNGGYEYVTEIGYMEIGNKKIALVPGEIEPSLVYGGKILEANYSYSGMDYQGSILKDIMGEDVIVIGLANDEIGYIIPDNDYCNIPMFARDYHMQELLVLHPNLGSELVSEYETLYKEVA